MSKKTSIKRIALVAAAALALGGFSAVDANATATTTVTASAASATLYAATTGTTVTDVITLTGGTSGDLTAGSVTAAVATKPTGSVATPSWTSTGANATLLANTTYSAGIATITATVLDTSAGVGMGTLNFTPDVAGKYTITVTPLALGSGTQTAVTVTIWAAGAAGTVGSSLLGSTSFTAVAGGNAKFVYVTPNGTATGTQFVATSAGVGSMVNATGLKTDGSTAENPTPYNGSAADFSAGATVTTATNTTPHTYTYTLTSLVAGTQTVTIRSIDGTTGTPTTAATVTITWGAASTISSSYTAAASFIDSGTAFPSVNGTVVFNKSVPAAFNSTTTGATIGINVKDSNNADMVGQPITVSISGPGLVSLTAGTGLGAIGTVRAASLTAAQMTTAVARVGVTADGTAGTATITVSSGTTTLFTKTVIFYGTVATLSATQNLSIASTAGATLGTATAAPTGLTVATTPAVVIVAKDANGNVVPGLTITAKSADTTVIASGSVVESSGLGAGDAYAGPGSYNASVTSAVGTSGASTTVVFRTLLADGVTYISTSPVSFTLGGKASTATYAAALDKAEYAVGDAAKLTITAKDSAGNPIFDQDLNLWGGLGTAPLWSKSVVGLLPSSTATAMFVGGKKAYTGYAPSLSGAFTLTGAIDPLVVTAGGSISASANVSGGDSSSLAYDAASAATDAANNAYEEAQNATQAASDALAAVKALAVQVKSLIALVNKIKAKLKA